MWQIVKRLLKDSTVVKSILKYFRGVSQVVERLAKN